MNDRIGKKSINLLDKKWELIAAHLKKKTQTEKFKYEIFNKISD